MESSNSSNVAVVASEDNDRQLMTQLLKKAGYSAGVFDSVDSANFNQADHSAVIFCHRNGTNGSTGASECALASEGLALTGLTLMKGVQRVVVFSDCKAEHTIVSALEQGAHHFFDLAESQIVMQARLEAALRQHSLQANRILDVAPFKFNLERRSVYKDGKLINLSPKEYEFAYYLFANRHRVVINSELMTSVWSLPSSMDARRIDTAACRVRKKMQLADASSGWSLRRIRRVGYELLWHGAQDLTEQRHEIPTLAARETARPERATQTATAQIARQSKDRPAISATALEVPRHAQEDSQSQSTSIAAGDQAREIA